MTVIGKRTAALCACAMSILLAACSNEEPTPPNILLVVLDDLGYNDLAINNQSDSPTPTLDQLAAEGIRFTRHYAESSCTPSRVALLTGVYPARVGAHPDLSGIDSEWETLPDFLSQQGYTNYMIGKWHAGDAHHESRPEFQGFDHWFGFTSQLYLRGPHNQKGYTRAKPTYKNPWLETETERPKKYKGHLTDILTDRAIEVMQSEQDPWFLYLSYYAPHSPIMPAKPYASNFPDTPAGRYQALKQQLDSNLKRVFSALEASGKADDTLVVVVSDNGGTAKSWPSNLPYYGTKATFYEGGVRTPLILRWPARWPAGEINDRTVTIKDIYPTIVSALGHQAPADLDGADIFSLEGERIHRWFSHNLWGDRYGMLSADGRWRLIAWSGVSHFLHNEDDVVSPDPVNRAEQESERLAAMQSDMEAWLESATRVTGLEVEKQESINRYTGQAFRRTPMTGTHTMGFTFRRGETDDTTRLVTQKGYVGIDATTDELKIVVDGNQLSVPAPEDQACFTLVVRTALEKDNMIIRRHDSVGRMWVYIDGKMVESSTYKNAKISRASPRSPLDIQTSSAGIWYMPAGSEIFLSTRAVTEKEVAGNVEALLKANCSG